MVSQIGKALHWMQVLGQDRVALFLQAMQWGAECDVAGRERWREWAVVTAAAAARARSGDRGGYSEAAQLKL